MLAEVVFASRFLMSSAFIFFVPGFALTILLGCIFGKRKHPTELFFDSVLLSPTIVIFACLILNYVGYPIRA